jgi:hypothetical protein
MWNEAQWGLNNLNNYIRWDDLLSTDPFIQSNAFNELMVRFDLTYELATIGANNYAAQWASTSGRLSIITSLMNENCPNPTSNDCVAYMQWSASAVTAVQGAESVV